MGLFRGSAVYAVVLGLSSVWVVGVTDGSPKLNVQFPHVCISTSSLLIVCVFRLNGSYEALSGGLMSEALTDVTGGIVERFELGRNAPTDLQNVMLKAFQKSSLMGCSIDVYNDTTV